MAQTTFTDDFTTGSGDLAGSAVGTSDLTWSDLVGTLTRGSDGLTGAVGSISTTDVAWPDVAESVPVDAAARAVVYARVQDANNWWRASIKVTTRITSTTTYFGGYGFVGNVSSYEGINASTAGPGPYFLDYVTTTQDGTGPTTRLDGPYSSSYFKKYTRPVLSTETTTNYYSVIIEKSVGGTVSTVATSSESTTMPSVLSLSVVGNVLTATLTAGSSTLTATTTDGAYNAVTTHGVGPGPTSWSCTLIGANTPPSIVSPANGADVDITAATVTIETGFPVTDPQTSADGRWRNAGDTEWTVVDGAFGSGLTWTIPEADLTSGTQVEVQPRATDSNGNTTDWGSSGFFTPRARPAAPVFVSPESGSDVVAADIAVVDFDGGAVSTARQARRVADDGSGDPDTATVYQAALTLTKITDGGDAGDYALSGDGSIHPTGAEHIQVRRQTAAGGTLWSDWADLQVTMALAAPFPPLVAVTPLAARAAVRFDVTTQPADIDHADADRIDFHRDGVRVASVGVVDGKASWTDVVPGTASDYVVVAVAVNGATASFGAAQEAA